MKINKRVLIEISYATIIEAPCISSNLALIFYALGITTVGTTVKKSSKPLKIVSQQLMRFYNVF